MASFKLELKLEGTNPTGDIGGDVGVNYVLHSHQPNPSKPPQIPVTPAPYSSLSALA